MREDWDELSAITGIKSDLVHINKSDRRDYREYYDEETADVVARIYAKDISHFGFSFEDKKISNFKRKQNGSH
jgi:hypothetical protein